MKIASSKSSQLIPCLPVTVLTLLVHLLAPVAGQRQEEGAGYGLASYFNAARQLLSNGMEAHQQTRSYSGLMPNEDPHTAQMLRNTIEQTTHLINDYRHEGLSSMPPLPNLPGLSTLMRLPDKLLRAELSMLQDGIRMAQELRERPISATMNTPRELANMFLKMSQQFNQ